MAAARPHAILIVALALIWSTLPAFGETTFTPIIGVNVDEFDFSCVRLERCRALNFRIFNAAPDPSAPLVITDIHAQWPEFELYGPEPPITLPDYGSSVSFNLQFCPSRLGRHGGVLRITAPGAVNSPLDLEMEGYGDDGIPPAAVPGGPYQGDLGVPVTFDGRSSAGDIHRYVWEFGDGRTDGGAVVTHTFHAYRVFDVTLTVTESCGQSSVAATTVTIGDNEEPVCDAGEPVSAQTDAQAWFDAGDSIDPDGEIVSFAWQFGDGGMATLPGAVISHVYQSPGDYTVTLTVTDDYHARTTCLTAASIFMPPFCIPGGPYTGEMGEPVTFDGTGSYDPQQATIDSYTWEFGDGTSAAGAIVDHVYGPNGFYTATLTLTSSLGGFAACAFDVTITGDNALPVCGMAPVPAVALDTDHTFDGTSSADPDGTITGYAWEFGDGSTAAGATPVHRYTQLGFYEITLCVTDDIGSRTCCGDTVGVSTPPICGLEEFLWLYVGDPWEFYCWGCSDPDGEIVEWRWDFGDGTTGSGHGAVHVYEEVGDFTVTLEIVDDTGLESTCQQFAVVFSEPAVLLSAFEARPRDGAVELRWRTGAESENAGFNLLRAVAGNRQRLQVNRELIPGGGDAAGDYRFVDATAVAGLTFDYWLEAVDLAGRTTEHGPVRVAVPHPAPARLALHPPVPTPFHATTTIRFELPAAGRAELTVHDALGRPVRTLVGDVREAAQHTIGWDGRDASGRELPSGIYFVRLTSGGAVATRKVVVVR